MLEFKRNLSRLRVCTKEEEDVLTKLGFIREIISSKHAYFELGQQRPSIIVLKVYFITNVNKCNNVDFANKQQVCPALLLCYQSFSTFVGQSPTQLQYCT